MLLRARLPLPLLFDGPASGTVGIARRRRNEGLVTPPRATARARKVVVLVAGTRPECIKLMPVLRALRAHPDFKPVLVNSGQHLASVNRSFAEFGVACDLELSPLPVFHHLAGAHNHLRAGLRKVFARLRPSLVLVQGDTLTAYSGARAAHDLGTALAHVEAGLRTDAISEPFPEEWFRRRIAQYAQIHFAPTRASAANLLAEGTDPRTVFQVGNTGIDSLRAMLGDLERALPVADVQRNTVLVTLHRRENHDRNARVVCDSLIDLVAARPDMRILFPVHPNPRVALTVRRRLASRASFTLVDPMSYREFIGRASRAALIISDSGGIQEEAPHLGTPLLVPRCNTERPEGIATGFVQLVAADRHVIVEAALAAINSPRRSPVPFDDDAPFGSGAAADKIVRVLETVLDARVAA